MKSNISPQGLSWTDFGADLLDTSDLDPLYVILIQANWDEKFLLRWLLGYWVFYSAGVASKLAEYTGVDFYNAMRAGDMMRWPRGHERRHMRGQNFQNCVTELQNFGEPEQVASYMTTGNDFKTIGTKVKRFAGFGPWIGWKIADMTDRVLGYDVDFSNAEIAVYRDPVKGAALIGFGDQEYAISVDEVHGVFSDMETTFSLYKAPPFYDRYVNIQEMETIACKYKSHCNGHYPVGLDTCEIYEGLHGWGDSAQELSTYLKPYFDNFRGAK